MNKLIDVADLSADQYSYSFEFFPPKNEEADEKFFNTISKLRDLKPTFCSVTWGAGGSGSKRSFDVISQMINCFNIPTVMHLTGLGMLPEELHGIIKKAQDLNIHNFLVLRGDKAHLDVTPNQDTVTSGFRYASEIVHDLRKVLHLSPDKARIFVAGCPEGHPESASIETDLDHLANKVNQGAEGIITQFFLNNSHYGVFRDGLISRDIRTPIMIGIMIITKAKMIEKMVQMSGCELPIEVKEAVNRYHDDDASMESWGIDYAVSQIEELLDQGCKRFHFYTMNRYLPTSKVINRIPRLKKCFSE